MIKISSGSKLNSTSVPPPSCSIFCSVAKFCKICRQTALGIRVSIHFCRTGKIRFQISKSYPENQLKSQNGVSDYFFTTAFGFGGWGSCIYLVSWLVGFGVFGACVYMCVCVHVRWICWMKASAPIFLTGKKSTWTSTWTWTQVSQTSGLRNC